MERESLERLLVGEDEASSSALAALSSGASLRVDQRGSFSGRSFTLG
jgi:hypothetical protein